MRGVKTIGLSRVVKNLSNAQELILQSGDGWIVGVGAEYGAYVEFGTSRSQPYPYLFPAAKTVMARDFNRLQRRANNPNDLIELLALAIEGQARDNASGRPGPRVITGYLRGSIRAAPAKNFR